MQTHRRRTQKQNAGSWGGEHLGDRGRTRSWAPRDKEDAMGAGVPGRTRRGRDLCKHADSFRPRSTSAGLTSSPLPLEQTPHQASWHMLTDDGRPLSWWPCWPAGPLGAPDCEWDCVPCTLYHVLSDFWTPLLSCLSYYSTDATWQRHSRVGMMRQFRQLVTRRQRILSRCGELEVHRAQEGLTIRPRVLRLLLRWLTKLAPGLTNTRRPLDTQPDVVAGQFEALSHRTGQAALRQCAHCS